MVSTVVHHIEGTALQNSFSHSCRGHDGNKKGTCQTNSSCTISSKL